MIRTCPSSDPSPFFKPRLSALATAVLAGGCLALASTAHAVTLNTPVDPAPYADTTLPGTTSAARPELAGTVLADVLTPFSFNGLSGTVQSRVVREDASGTLDFYWKVSVDPHVIPALTVAPLAAVPTFDITALRVANFGVSNITDADWRSDDLADVAPATARVFSASAYPTGDVNFLFNAPVLAAGQSSDLFFLHTNATSYAQTALFDLVGDGLEADAISSSFATFAPAVPEPGAWLLVGVGLAMVLGVGARQRAGAAR
jgi:hypothetical protein